MIQRDMLPYFDGNDLVSSTAVPSGVMRASDNGVLHSSRYLILQHLAAEPRDQDAVQAVLACIDQAGYLHRAPDDTSPDAPDDHYGLFSLLNTLNLTNVPVALPWACHHPMLLYMRALSRGGWRSFLARGLSLPMAVLIAASNLREPASDTSNKLLTWNIIQGTRKSLLCQLGAALWNARVNSLAAAQIYYAGNPPMMKYWRK